MYLKCKQFFSKMQKCISKSKNGPDQFFLKYELWLFVCGHLSWDVKSTNCLMFLMHTEFKDLNNLNTVLMTLLNINPSLDWSPREEHALLSLYILTTVRWQCGNTTPHHSLKRHPKSFRLFVLRDAQLKSSWNFQGRGPLFHCVNGEYLRGF